MRKVAIQQPQSIPWPAYFDKILKSDIFIILDDVQFQKNGLQNRNRIKTPSGKAWLTMPVNYSLGQLINNVKISSPKMKIKHLRTLHMNYANSQYFSSINKMFSTILDQDDNFISSISIELIKVILIYLGYQGEIILSSELKIKSKGSSLIKDLCKAVDASCYLSGIGGKNYLIKEDFIRNDIFVKFQQFEMPKYNQCFPGQEFIPDLSIIDLLFNEGKESRYIMELARKPYLDWD